MVKKVPTVFLYINIGLYIIECKIQVYIYIYIGFVTRVTYENKQID